MSEHVDISFEAYGCRCADRSWSFPATAAVGLNGHQFQAHWRDGVGWCPCDLSEEEFTRLYSVLEELNLDAPTFDGWQALISRAMGEVNKQSIEYWHEQWVAAVERHLDRVKKELEHAVKRVEHQRNLLVLAECRSTACRLSDPDLAALVQRLLDTSSWSGSPAELVATAEAVLARR